MTNLFLTMMLACGDDKDDTSLAATASDGISQTTDTSTTETGTVDCETNIDDDVPDFYKQYFQCVNISMNGDDVVISSDGLPPHKSYYYGQGHDMYTDFDRSGERSSYNPNPNTIASQNHSITIPANPVARDVTVDASAVDGEVNSSTDEYGMGTVGLALDGVSIFNSLAAPGDVIENEISSFDIYNAHPEISGNYHYHTDSMGPLEVLVAAGHSSSSTPGAGELEVYGMMCDGTVVMGCTELDSAAASNNGLDAQNGHIHDLTDSDGTTHFADRYHVHICTDTLTDFIFTPEIQYYDTCN